jgi:TolA-binding protein
MAKPEPRSTNNVSNASSSWLLPIEQRISSVQKETEELRQSNRELSEQLLQLRKQNVASHPEQQATALV